jgi:hypothetical protein
MQSNPVLDKMMIEYAKLHVQLVIANETVQKLGQENAALTKQLSIEGSAQKAAEQPEPKLVEVADDAGKDSIGE